MHQLVKWHFFGKFPPFLKPVTHVSRWGRGKEENDGGTAGPRYSLGLEWSLTMDKGAKQVSVFTLKGTSFGMNTFWNSSDRNKGYEKQF